MLEISSLITTLFFDHRAREYYIIWRIIRWRVMAFEPSGLVVAYLPHVKSRVLGAEAEVSRFQKGGWDSY